MYSGTRRFNRRSFKNLPCEAGRNIPAALLGYMTVRRHEASREEKRNMESVRHGGRVIGYCRRCGGRETRYAPRKNRRPAPSPFPHSSSFIIFTTLFHPHSVKPLPPAYGRESDRDKKSVDLIRDFLLLSKISLRPVS